jgi:hypothetical protein
MKPRFLAALLLAAGLLLMLGLAMRAEPTAAQDEPGRVQRITALLQAGEVHAYLLKDLQAGDRLAASMRATSGNLDPMIGIVGTDTPLREVMTAYGADVQRLVAGNEAVGPALEALRDRTFLAWDDDGGEGYAAVLEYVVPAPGDYALIAASALSAFGRATSGDYELLIGLNAPAGAAQPAGAPLAERIPNPWGPAASVQGFTRP